MWTVELEPEVEQWMDRLSETEFGATLPHVERLAERGNELRMPHLARWARACSS